MRAMMCKGGWRHSHGFYLCLLLVCWPAALAQPPKAAPAPSRAPPEAMPSGAEIPEDHPVAKVLSCLEEYGLKGPLKAATYKAYKEQEEVARLLPLKLWHSNKDPPQEVLTVVTTLTPERLDMLEAQCNSWSGPLTAVMYVPVVDNPTKQQTSGVFSEDQWKVLQPAEEALEALFARMEAASNSCILTALLAYEYVDKTMAVQLPINTMRNQAVLLAQTPLIAMLDVDLMVSSNFAASLTEPAEAKALLDLAEGQKRFVVLPAFDPNGMARSDIPQKDAEQRIIAEQLKLAEYASKSEKTAIQGLLETKLLEAFNQRVNREGHGETNLRSWFRCNKPECRSYKINPVSPRFEPWGILDRHLALKHPYDEIYRGYGKNKIANVILLREQEFELHVHGSGFVVHRPHALSNAKKVWSKEFEGPSGVPLNSVKFDIMKSAMARKLYTPKVAASTAACAVKQLGSGFTS